MNSAKLVFSLLRFAAIGLAVAGAGLILFGGIAYLCGARINSTRSIPLGLYWLTDAPATKGTYVVFCPPTTQPFALAKARGYISAGFCPGDYGYMMKRLLAAKGDLVAFAPEGVRVNGTLLPLSRPYLADAAGRPLPQYEPGTYRLGEAEVLLIGDVSAKSFDARYFGPVFRSQIVGVIRPVFTW